MTPFILAREELKLDTALSSMAIGPDGQRVYLGCSFSSDPTRENLAVLKIDSQNGLLQAKHLYRDSDQPLPLVPTPQSKVALRPRSSVIAILVEPRYNKLYLIAQLDDLYASTAGVLTIYNLDPNGDPEDNSIRSYRIPPAAPGTQIALTGLALHPKKPILYLVDNKSPVVRYYQLDQDGLPLDGQAENGPLKVTVEKLGFAAIAISPDGQRLFLGSISGTAANAPPINDLKVLYLNADDGTPSEANNGTPNVKAFSSNTRDPVSRNTDYVRFVHTRRALYRVPGNPGVSYPLMVWSLDANGDPSKEGFRIVDRYQHTGIVASLEGDRLWIARDTTEMDKVTQQTVTDGIELVALPLNDKGVPIAKIQSFPKVYLQHGLLAAVAANTGDLVLLTQTKKDLVVNYAKGIYLRVKITDVTTPPGSPTPSSLTCSLQGVPIGNLKAGDSGELSEWVNLDEAAFKLPLPNNPGQVLLNISVSDPLKKSLIVGFTAYIEVALDNPAQNPAQKPTILTDTVFGNKLLLLVPGYAFTAMEERKLAIELFSKHWKRYRIAAEAVQIEPSERPDQFVVSGFALYGGQGHVMQLEDGLAALRALGINTIQLRAWDGISVSDLGKVFGQSPPYSFSPASVVYSPPLYYFFDFLYDGNLTVTVKGKQSIADNNYLRAWCLEQAQAVQQSFGISASQIVQFQLADEPGWYYPAVLRWFSRDSEPPTPNSSLTWADEMNKNKAWRDAFTKYLTDQGLRPEQVQTGATTWEKVIPLGASQATTPETRRLFYWTMRFFADQAAIGAERLCREIEKAFKTVNSPTLSPGRESLPREHSKLHVTVNFGETLDWQWYKPYPNAIGDKNPDRGPDAATGGFDWFTFGVRGMPFPLKHTYVGDANAQVWSFYGDLLRSAVMSRGQELPSFGGLVPGISIGDLPTGASYKILSLVGRGAKTVTIYAFGPVFLFAAPNSWADNFAAYPAIAEALRLVGRAQRVLYPGQPEWGHVAIHFPSSSRLWDDHQKQTFYSRELQPLHTALTHDGYAVDFVDDRDIEDGTLASRGYSILYLVGPNLSEKAQQAIRSWVIDGGTLAVMPGSGVANEYNEPTTIVDEMLGLQPNSRSAMREFANLGLWRLPHKLVITGQQFLDILGESSPVEVPVQELFKSVLNANGVYVSAPLSIPTLELNGASAIASLVPVDGMPSSSTQRPGITIHDYGKGLAFAYAFFPGWQYWRTASRRFTDRLPQHWGRRERLLATLPTRLVGTPKSVVVSHEMVEVRCLQSPQGIALVILNWMYEPIRMLKITVPKVGSWREVTSARGTRVTSQPVDDDTLEVTLSINTTDVVVIE
jgi:hypothetical protein